MDDRAGAARRAAGLAARIGAGGTQAARVLLRGGRGDRTDGVAAAPLVPTHAVLGDDAYRHALQQVALLDSGRPVEPGQVPMPVRWSHPRRTEPLREGDAPDGVLDLLDPADGRLVGALLVRMSPREQLAPTPGQALGRVLAAAVSDDDIRPLPQERSYDALVDAHGRLVARRRFVNGGTAGTAGDEIRDATGALVATCVGRPQHDWLWGDGTPAPYLVTGHYERDVDLHTGGGRRSRELTRTRHTTGGDGQDWWTCELTEHVDPVRRLGVQALRLLPNLGCLVHQP